MKIIGQTAEGFLLSATPDELANLTGYYSKYDPVMPAVRIGDDVKISEMFRTLYNMASHRKELAQTAAKLRVCADAIELTEPIVRECTNTNQVQ